MLKEIIEQLKKDPHRKDNIILNHVLTMVDRGDSKQTIFDVVKFLSTMQLYTLQNTDREVHHD